MENIRCLECGATLLGYALEELSPFGHDSCPSCGHERFERVSNES